MARAGDHPWPSWFQDSVQHAQLLTNRTLRGYLLSHNAERWPEVVKATLLVRAAAPALLLASGTQHACQAAKSIAPACVEASSSRPELGAACSLGTEAATITTLTASVCSCLCRPQYGVLCLQRDFPGQPALELAQLHEASRRLHAEAALGAALPRIRSEFQSLEADVGGFLAELDPNRHGGGGSGGRAVG